jgi:hypothetical protein
VREATAGGQVFSLFPFFVREEKKAKNIATHFWRVPVVRRGHEQERVSALGFQEFWIEGAGGTLAFEESGEVLRGSEGHAAAGFGGGGSEVRSEDDIRAFEADVDERFLLEYVEAGAGDFSGFESVDQSGFVYDGAAGSVDEEGGCLHAEKFRRVEESAGVAVERNVQ